LTLAGRVRGLVAGHPRVALAADRVVEHFPTVGDTFVLALRGDPRKRYATWVAEYDSLAHGGFGRMASADLPDVSVVLLSETVRSSLERQLLRRFDVAMTDPARAGVGVRRARNEHVVLVDGSAMLRPHALLMLAHTLAEHPDAVAVYGDDDVLSAEEARRDHYFKPSWNESLLRAHNYFGGAVALRRSHALAVDVEDAADPWELLLRLTAGLSATSVRRIPYVLSHRQSQAPEKDALRHEARLAEVDDIAAVRRVGQSSYRVSYRLPERRPTVSVIVPSRCDQGVLEPCLDGVLRRTAYDECEVVIVANGVSKPSPYLDSVRAEPRTRVLECDGHYNFSGLNNLAVSYATGELLCFLNDDTEVLEPNWLASLVGHVLRRNVGAVGALLLYPNGRIQHAGVVLGTGWVATHAYRGARRDAPGYHDRALVTQDVSCVTAACMLVRREAFLAVGGFDTEFPTRYNDVDFCLRLWRAGLRVVWTPDAVLRHKESTSLRRRGRPEERDLALLAARWGDKLAADPYHNPNLSLDPLTLWEPAFPPRVPYPPVRATTAYSPVS
jgi:O-antigen biosynthesis protein